MYFQLFSRFILKIKKLGNVTYLSYHSISHLDIISKNLLLYYFLSTPNAWEWPSPFLAIFPSNKN
jgi:hypothetical protein